jgi:translation elongation factor EF-1alpha
MNVKLNVSAALPLISPKGITSSSRSALIHTNFYHIIFRTLSTSSRNFIILDAPGHKDFVPNMIKGAAQADVALLVVPATPGEYETSMSMHAQTREHAALLKALVRV